MGSAVVPEFFKWARENYDRVIIDSPPFGIVGDVMTLASLVDSVMIMCCPDRTHFKPIQHAARTLGESGATVIGIVVNDVEMGGAGSAFTPVGHAYGYGYGYGGYRAYGAYGAYSPYGPIKDKKGTGTKADATQNAAAESAGVKTGATPGDDETPIGADPPPKPPKPSPDITDEA